MIHNDALDAWAARSTSRLAGAVHLGRSHAALIGDYHFLPPPWLGGATDSCCGEPQVPCITVPVLGCRCVNVTTTVPFEAIESQYLHEGFPTEFGVP